MDILNELKELGADIDDGLIRFMNKPDLYAKMLLKLPPNLEKLEVLSYMEAGDFQTALSNAHTIKGVAGNLSVTPLYKAYTEIVNLLRADKPEEAKQLLLEILPVQDKILSCIKKYS